MILTIRGEESSDIPLELREPIFFLNEERNTFLDYEKNNNKLEITQFNFFVGANNSGKSRFMRGLLKLNSYKNHFSEKIHFKELSNYISSIQTQGLEQGKQLYLILKNQVDKKNLIDTNIELIENFSNKNNEDLTKQIESLKKEMSSVLSEKVRNEVKKYISLVEQYQKELNFSKEHKISKKNYTPVLRSLLNNIDLEGGRFKEAVEVRYFGAVGEFTEHNDIHTGLELWSHVKDMISSIKNRDIREFEFFLSKFFFGNEKVALVPDTKSRLIHLDFEKQGYRGIHEIGDGIQALIILLFPIFMAEKNEVFFIEEPEMNLHPGFQRIFIETLLNNEFLKQKNLKYFFTTHSNHFLDLTLKNNKVSFFQFKKLEEGKHLIKTKIKPDKEVLDELGVNTSSVLLANTSIWVEGPTDRI